ncbi:hypothetical protein PA08_1787 [Cutibacterium modestum P08]|nr:hypothetical protein PA08_1787 [Cutibacterium modestum P08]
MRLSLPPSTRLAVMNGAARRSADDQTRLIGAPAEVHAVTEKGKCWVETTKAAPHVQPDEHASRRAAQDRARISLFLVNISAVDDRQNTSTAGADALPLLINELRVIMPSRFEQCGVQDVRVRLARSLPQHASQRITTHLDVVVQDPDMGDIVRESVDRQANAITGGGIRASRHALFQQPLAHSFQEQLGGTIRRAKIDGNLYFGALTTTSQCVEGPRQPTRRLMHEKDSRDLVGRDVRVCWFTSLVSPRPILRISAHRRDDRNSPVSQSLRGAGSTTAVRLAAHVGPGLRRVRLVTHLAGHLFVDVMEHGMHATSAIIACRIMQTDIPDRQGILPGSNSTGSCRNNRGPTPGHARLRSRRLSISDSPPQIPNLSSFSRAYSKHSWRTSQDSQMRLASRVDPPFSGKNASGSVWAHNALSCHSGSSSPPPASKVKISSMGEAPRDQTRRVPRRCTNYTREIHRATFSRKNPVTSGVSRRQM